MMFKIGEIVTLKHYSGKKITKGIITNICSEHIIIRPEKDFLIYNYFDNDPIVVGYEEENIINVCEGIISFIDYEANYFGLEIQSIEPLTDKRITERYPVSLFAYTYYNNEKSFAYIRNISLDGISLCSRHNFEKGSNVAIHTMIENSDLTIQATVMWKKDNKHGFEYGLEFSPKKELFAKVVEDCISVLKMDQESAIRSLKCEFESLRKALSKANSMN